MSLYGLFIFVSEKMSFNPWAVDDIQAFYFLKCPECNFIDKDENSFQDHAVENHPLSSAFYGESDKTIEKIGIFDDCNEENETDDALNIVKEEVLETRNDHEMDENIFPIKNDIKIDIVHDVMPSETVNQIFPVSEIREPTTAIPLMTQAAAQIAHSIPASKIKREILDDAPLMNTFNFLTNVGIDFTQKTRPQPSSSNLISPSIVNNRKKKYKCKICDTSFNMREKLMRHIAAIHEGQKLFNCSICDTNFYSKQNMNQHISSVHEGQKPFRCSICDASFTHGGSLKTHISSIHEGQKFKCSNCDASFTQSASLKTHIATVHEGQKPFKCSICDASFIRNARLKVHIGTVHEGKKPIKCSICDASFP